mmetsp:Transcript_28302/g.74269  ORF Transcript_28302/g.74269 Transcript_28302/m.74269 type:complete len:214 (+) Transcript_28302:573-1214(+)
MRGPGVAGCGVLRSGVGVSGSTSITELVASPKSPSFTLGRPPTAAFLRKMLRGLTSRWIKPLPWMWAIPRSTWVNSPRPDAVSTFPPALPRLRSQSCRLTSHSCIWMYSRSRGPLGLKLDSPSGKGADRAPARPPAAGVSTAPSADVWLATELAADRSSKWPGPGATDAARELTCPDSDGADSNVSGSSYVNSSSFGLLQPTAAVTCPNCPPW